MSYPVIPATAPTAPPAGVSLFQGLGMTWESYDGSTWDLTDYRGGVVLAADGVEGLHDPEFDIYQSRSRAIPGSRRRGWQAKPRVVVWRVYLWGDGSVEWLARYRAFFGSLSLDPDRAGTWRVRALDSERTLQLVLNPEDAHVYAKDPLIRGWALYTIVMKAEQPYWMGSPAKSGPWGTPAQVPFFGDVAAPDYFISDGSNLTDATLSSTGDVRAWPTWTVTGPLTSIRLGVSGRVIQVPLPLEAGETLRIVTDPRNVSATIDGVDVLAQLGLQPYAPVSPGQNVPLSIAAVGTGTVLCEVPQLYYRAF